MKQGNISHSPTFKIKYFFVVLFSLFFIQGKVNSQVTWDLNNSHWTLRIPDGMSPGSYYDQEISIDSVNTDTTINSITYKKVSYGTFAVRSDNRKLYGISLGCGPPHDTIDYLLFDFAANVGDTVHHVMTGSISPYCGYYENFYVAAKDSFKINNKYYNILNVEHVGMRNTTYWFENIGCTNGIVSADSMLVDIPNLICYTNNDTVRYVQSQTLTNFPPMPLNGATIQVYPGNSCSSIGAGLEESENLISWSIIPNPNSGNFQLCINKYSEAIDLNVIKISDVTGRIVWQKENLNSGTINIDIQQYPSGLYFIYSTTDSGEIQTAKFVKE